MQGGVALAEANQPWPLLPGPRPAPPSPRGREVPLLIKPTLNNVGLQGDVMTMTQTSAFKA